MKLPRIALSAALAVSGALVAASTTAAPARAAAPTTGCDTLAESGYRQSIIATGVTEPRGIDVDTAGVVYVGHGEQVDKLTPADGSYTRTTAGGSFTPYAIAVGNDGTIYVADRPNGKVEKLVPSGGTYTEQNVAWGYGGGLAALDVDASGAVYIGDTSNQRITKLTPGGGGYTPSGVDSLPLTEVRGIAVFGTTLWFTMDDDTVRALNIPGHTPGNPIPTSGLSGPRGLDLDPSGPAPALVVADTGNNRVVRFSLAGDALRTLPADGLDQPQDIAAGLDGNLYVADTGNDRVVRLTPLAVDADADTATTSAGDAVTADVLGNDTADGTDLADAPTIATNPEHGTATVNPNGTITYAPAAGFSGTDTYVYAVRDASGTVCATAKVTVTVSQDNACGAIGTTGPLTRLPIETGTDYPTYVDANAGGDLFVTDSENGLIAKLTPSEAGYTRSVAATGVGNVGAIAVDDSDDDGRLWVVRYPGQVLELTPSGSTYAIANTYSGGLLNNVGGIDVAPNGDVYVSINATSFGTGGVVRLSGPSRTQTQVISGLDVPHQVTVDDDGAVYVASYTRVVKYDGTTQTDAVTGLGSGQGVAVDSTGTLWISTTEDPGVWTAAPAGAGYAAKQLYAPWGANNAYNLVVTDDDTVFVADFERLWEFGPLTVEAQDDTATVGANGSVTTDVRANDVTNSFLDEITVVSAPAHGTATVNADATVTYRPTPGFSGADHYDYLARDEDGLVCAVARVTLTVTTSDGCGDIPSKEYGYDLVVSDDDFVEPAGVAIDSRNFVLIADAAGARVNAWAPGAGPSPIDQEPGLDPQGIATDAQGNVYYADEGEHEIVKLTWSEDDNDYTTRTVLAQGLQRPAGVAVDADGDVFFTERASGHVHRLTPSGGSYTSSLVASGLGSPRGIAVGADGDLFVADRSDNRLVRLTPSGADYALSVVSTSLLGPVGVTVRPDGVLLVADTENRRVLQLTPNGSGYAQTVAQRWDTRTPTWIAAPDNDRLIVSDPENDDILMMVAVGITAEDDTATTTLAAPVTTDVRANDIGIDGAPAVTTVSVPPDGGMASVGPDGRITYTPQAGFSGTDRYVYQNRVTLEGSAEFIGITAYLHIDVCDSAEVTVTVPNVFTAGPGVTTPQNEPVTTAIAAIVTTGGAALDPTAVTQAQAPAHGSLSVDGVTGAVTYTPDAGYSGADSYRVRVCDTADPAECAEITVPVTVEANTVTAEDDTATTSVAEPVVTDVAANDDSASGQAFGTITVSTPSDSGSTTVDGSEVTFTPDPGFSGATSYGYRICDTSTPTPVCDQATVHVTVDNVFVAGPGLSTPQNQSVAATTAGIATTAGMPLDPSGSSIVQPPGHGTAILSNGTLTYIPLQGFSGSDSVAVTVCDTSTPQQCATITVPVTVGVNTVTAGDDTASTTVVTAVTTDVVDNDTSTSGQALAEPTIDTAPGHGSTAVVGDAITYTPDAGFSGDDSYVYEICDTSNPTPVCDTGTVTVTVDNVFTTGASVTTAYNTPVTTGLDDYATTTGRPLAPAATTLVTGPGHGSISIDPTTGAVTYSPSAGFSGSDGYTVQVCDSSVPVQCAEASIDVTVQTKPAPTSGPTITVHAPDKATLEVTKAGKTKPVALTGSVTVTGINPATRVSGKAVTGSATLYGPAKKPGPGMCTPAAAVATVSFAPVNGTTALPAVTVDRPGHYTWVASTSADGDNLASTQSCGAPDSTTLVHRPSLPAKITVKTGYAGVVAAPAAHGRRIRPVRISIPALRLNTRLQTVGIRKRDMVIPTDPARGGWLAGSAAPGESVGSTVIAGHVSDRGDRPGAFGRLRRARPGQVVVVKTADGSVRRYRIETVTTQPRTKGLTGATTSTTGEHRLTLVTCTGRVTYPNGRFHYTKNLVVTAVPIG
ncbi:Ig-like domain-containing protein [Nocardioides nitrophenolicus]|uniref:Ig-like domain-containing protein n=1 Tax=Nocardioides nitrophenolicus TaxID=60489 RepID=UPI00195DB6C8|nr:Ig-like domain-containing protein [Nocardioides nitrophenolicus]MBM7516701.1 streptogramin lyase [Nocardioides nitrophenolicus]